MQIASVHVTPVEMHLKTPFRSACHAEAIEKIPVVFVRAELVRQAESAWGCATFDPVLGGVTLEQVTAACLACADRLPQLSPLNVQYALAELAPLTVGIPAVRCAFDLLLHDLLGLWTGLPLYRLLGGFRNRIQTSITLSFAPVHETVAMARARAKEGFRILKLKGGLDAEEDVRRVQAVHTALPALTLRLDADQGYSVPKALDVARALDGRLEFLEQPTPAGDLAALKQVTELSPLPILADESLTGPESALQIVSQHAAHGISTKLASCGGLDCARQIDTIARAGGLTTMVGCLNEPGLLIAAGLGLALSSPNVRYGDLDGHFDLVDDPTQAGFQFKDGWLVASERPGLGCRVVM
jgi:L-alanine-DL-glutamate epimerase-like enolase superfamily enzyme